MSKQSHVREQRDTVAATGQLHCNTSLGAALAHGTGTRKAQPGQAVRGMLCAGIHRVASAVEHSARVHLSAVERKAGPPPPPPWPSCKECASETGQRKPEHRQSLVLVWLSLLCAPWFTPCTTRHCCPGTSVIQGRQYAASLKAKHTTIVTHKKLSVTGYTGYIKLAGCAGAPGQQSNACLEQNHKPKCLQSTRPWPQAFVWTQRLHVTSL